MVFKTNVKKNGKNEDFWTCNIIPTALIFKSFMLFLFCVFITLCCHDMQRNWIQNMALPMYSTVFVFCIN